MKKICVPILCFGLSICFLTFSNNQYVMAQDISSAILQENEETVYSTLEVVFVKEMANKGLSFLSDSSVTLEQRKESFRKLFRDNFDIKRIGQFAVGATWKTMSEEQKKSFLQEFESYIVNIYSRRFQNYNGQSLEFSNKTKTIGSDVMVSSFLILKTGEKIDIDWRVKNKDGQYRIIDIVVKGVSMTVTQRSDFSSTIQRGGGKIDFLIEKLKTQNAK